MNDTSRYSTADTKRQLADPARWPLLARLPDVSADPLAPRPTKTTRPGAIEYRFDPPQTTDTKSQPAIPGPPRVSQSAVEPQPHVFERRRAAGLGRTPRRESPILPRSNPFSIPRPRLIDSFAPAVRFLTMVALFAAAGTWIQMMGRGPAPPAPSAEPAKTAAQQLDVPAKNAADHTVPAPTATGPIETNPQSGARVGRADGDDFANEGKSAARALPVGRPAATPPHFLVAEGQVPRVQTTEPKTAGVGAATDGDEDQSPSMARHPGFLFEIPTR